jgi:hypothetical protein
VLLVVVGLGSVRWCCRLSVALVLSLGGGVGAVGCGCCQLSVALFRRMVMAVGAVGFWWPWFCPFVDLLVLPVALVPSVWLSSVRQISGLIMQRVFHEMPPSKAMLWDDSFDVLLEGAFRPGSLSSRLYSRWMCKSILSNHARQMLLY